MIASEPPARRTRRPSAALVALVPVGLLVVLSACGPSASAVRLTGNVVPPVATVQVAQGTMTLTDLSGTQALAQAQTLSGATYDFSVDATSLAKGATVYKLGFTPSGSRAGFLLTRAIVLSATSSGTVSGDLTASSSVVAMGIELAYRVGGAVNASAVAPPTLEASVPRTLTQAFTDLVAASQQGATGVAPTADPTLALAARAALSPALGPL